MITRLNTYEGVPIGGNNFEDFLEYVRGFLGANFAFSTRATGNSGGYFKDDGFEYRTFSAVGPGLLTWFFGPVDPAVDSGSLFGRYENEFYRFVVSNPDKGTGTTQGPHIQTWEILLTDSNSTNSLLFENTSVTTDERQLPYRPVKLDSDVTYDYGYEDIRINGIPQDISGLDYTFSYPSEPGLALSAQSVEFTKLSFGAEYPVPLVNDRYDTRFKSATYLDAATGTTRLDFIADLDSSVAFEFTNFSIESGGHILLTRELSAGPAYSYVPQDFSSGEDVEAGHYKVIDYTNGVIKFNINTGLLEPLRTSELEAVNNVNFTIISVEQLLEQASGPTTNYYTKYGSVYDGEAGNVKLLEYLFDGTDHVVQKIPETNYVTNPGDLLLQDASQQYSDSIVLAVAYQADFSLASIEEAQVNRYRPDFVRFYYHPGIITSVGTGSIRAIVEINKDSWYNRDILDAEYFPVNRTESANYSLITLDEVPLFTFTFDPNIGFQIIDTVNIEDLNVAGLSLGDVLVYAEDGVGGFTFVGEPYSLLGLYDTATNSAINNNVLTYDTTTSKWVNKTVVQALGYTPYNQTGGDITGTARIVASGGHLTFRNPTAPTGSQVWHISPYFADGRLVFSSNATDTATNTGGSSSILELTGGADGGIRVNAGINSTPGVALYPDYDTGLTRGSDTDPGMGYPLVSVVGSTPRFRVRNNSTSPAEVHDGTGWKKLAFGTLSGADLAPGSILTASIGDGEVTDPKISSVSASKVTGTISNSQLATGIDASKLTTGTMPIARLADKSVTPEKTSFFNHSKIYSGIVGAGAATYTLPVGQTGFQWTITNLVAGTYMLLHDLGTTEYAVVATLTGSSANTIVTYGNKQNGRVDFYMKTIAGADLSSAMSFIIVLL